MTHKEFKLALKVLRSYTDDSYRRKYDDFMVEYGSWSDQEHKDFSRRIEQWRPDLKDDDEGIAVFEFWIVEEFLLHQLHEGLSEMAREAKHHSEYPEDCDYSIARAFLSMYGRDHLPKRVIYGEGGEELIKGVGGQYYLKLQTEPSPLAPDKVFYYFSDDGELMAKDSARLIPIEE